MSGMSCYVCMHPGDNIASECREVFLQDDDHKVVYVGPTCLQKVKKAGAEGVLCGGIGPRVFYTYDQAAAYAARPDTKGCNCGTPRGQHRRDCRSVNGGAGNA